MEDDLVKQFLTVAIAKYRLFRRCLRLLWPPRKRDSGEARYTWRVGDRKSVRRATT